MHNVNLCAPKETSDQCLACSPKYSSWPRKRQCRSGMHKPLAISSELSLLICLQGLRHKATKSACLQTPYYRGMWGGSHAFNVQKGYSQVHRAQLLRGTHGSHNVACDTSHPVSDAFQQRHKLHVDEIHGVQHLNKHQSCLGGCKVIKYVDACEEAKLARFG